jgi:hypothetical protein
MVFQKPALSADIVNVVGIDEKGGAVVVDIQVRDYLEIYPPKMPKISFCLNYIKYILPSRGLTIV